MTSEKYQEKYRKEEHEKLVRMVQGAAAMVIALNGSRDIAFKCEEKKEKKEKTYGK